MSIPLFDRWLANRFVNRIAHKSAFALVMLLCVLWSAASALHRPPAPAAAAVSEEWPSEWDGVALVEAGYAFRDLDWLIDACARNGDEPPSTLH